MLTFRKTWTNWMLRETLCPIYLMLAAFQSKYLQQALRLNGLGLKTCNMGEKQRPK